MKKVAFYLQIMVLILLIIPLSQADYDTSSKTYIINPNPTINYYTTNGSSGNGSQWNITGSLYLYNNSGILDWNESKGNITILGVCKNLNSSWNYTVDTDTNNYTLSLGNSGDSTNYTLQLERFGMTNLSFSFNDRYEPDTNTQIGNCSGTGDCSNIAYTNQGNVFGSFNQSFDTDTLFVDSTNDRVGIGTTTPGYPLEVVGNRINIVNTGSGAQFVVNRTDGATFEGSASSNFGILGTRTDHPLRFRVNTGLGGNLFMETDEDFCYATNMSTSCDDSDVVFYINGSNGNTGIGTNSPDYKLHVVNTGSTGFVINRTDGSTAKLFAGSGAVQYGSVSDHDVVFIVDDDKKMMSISDTTTNKTCLGYNISNDCDGGNEQLTLDMSTGNVGIGINNPINKLEVVSLGGTSSDRLFYNFTDDQNHAELLFMGHTGGTTHTQIVTGLSDSRLTIMAGNSSDGAPRIAFIGGDDSSSVSGTALFDYGSSYFDQKSLTGMYVRFSNTSESGNMQFTVRPEEMCFSSPKVADFSCAGGYERLYINLTSGFVGIDDITPNVLLDVEGGISSKAHFWGVRSSEYNTANTNYNLLSFDNVYLNDSTFYTHDGTGNITIQKAGWYMADARCQSDLDSGTREDSQCAIYVNGVLQQNCGMYSREIGVLGTGCAIPSMLNLTVNDVVGVYFRGGAVGVDCGDGSANCMTFRMEYVRDV